jgi:hypothetical protein
MTIAMRAGAEEDYRTPVGRRPIVYRLLAGHEARTGGTNRIPPVPVDISAMSKECHDP